MGVNSVWIKGKKRKETRVDGREINRGHSASSEKIREEKEKHVTQKLREKK